MAVAAAAAGADRIFLMGYDYRTGRSEPGATRPARPLRRRDRVASGRRSTCTRRSACRPDRLLLGLPLYGVDWPVAGPVIGAPSTGEGEAWFPRAHVDLLHGPAKSCRSATRSSRSTSTSAPPTAPWAPTAARRPTSRSRRDPSPGASVETRTWRAVYVDTPATLAPKLELANEHGLAGAGFWAIGYSAGCPATRT